jgi:broad specificity phosphatase PhoE
MTIRIARVGLVAWLLVVSLSLVSARGAAAPDAEQAWAALVAGGHVALIRHANAPPGYGGDPPGFRMDDCKTQRNLDELGRQQAQALGEAFRQRGVRVDRVLASPVCRCVDTAELMAVGPVEKSMALLPDRGEPRVRLLELQAMVSGWRGPGTLVLVTHGFTISPLLRTHLEQAETLVLKPGGGSGAVADIVGRIPTPQ